MTKDTGRPINPANVCAWKDWERVAKRAVAAGRSDLVEMYAPPANAGWRRVDKAAAKVMVEMGEITPKGI